MPDSTLRFPGRARTVDSLWVAGSGVCRLFERQSCRAAVTPKARTTSAVGTNRNHQAVWLPARRQRGAPVGDRVTSNGRCVSGEADRLRTILPSMLEIGCSIGFRL